MCVFHIVFFTISPVFVIWNIQVELLLGKAYSDWGHVSDALAVYDQLISTHPDDFRGYLAKVSNFSPLLTNHGAYAHFCSW